MVSVFVKFCAIGTQHMYLYCDLFIAVCFKEIWLLAP